MLLFAVSAAGCSSRGQRNEDFITPEGEARKAIDTYLESWKNGEFDQALPGTKPQIMVVDDTRLKKRPLKEYRVLGAVPADAPLCFAVQLSLDNPKAEVRERYVIVGRDPIWVWRYDDYVMITHWEHDMSAPASPSKKP